MKHIVVAMSGGVDSSVVAALLKEQGHRVIGVTLRLLKKETGFGCCGSTRDIDDARAVCTKLDVPHYVMDFADTFKDNIIDPFVSTYLAGETPNPCIACNRFVKFDALLKKAVALGADAVATGHYAQIEKRSENGQDIFHLQRAVDRHKDQSYVLHNLGQHQLSRLMFPIGGLTKDMVRDLAHRYDLKTAAKPESMEICFVPNADTKAYVKDRAAKDASKAATIHPGPIVTTDGEEVGTHDGVAFYTRGQRQGLRLSLGKPMYVVDLKPETNTVVVGEDRETVSPAFVVGDVHWTHGHAPSASFEALVQIRSHHKAVSATLTIKENKVEGIWSDPQRAVTPGQAAVFYQGDEVIGGGTLMRMPATSPSPAVLT